MQTGTYVDPGRVGATVGELAPVWLAGKINLKPTSRARYADVLPRWGDIPAGTCHPERHPGWLAELSGSGLSGASVRKAHGVLSGSSVRPSATGGPGRAAVLVLSYCGLRWSELAALRVRNFDLLRRRVIIEEAVTEVDGSTVVWST